MAKDPSLDIQEGLCPVTKALITQKVLWHPNLDIRVLVVSCLSEIARITAPDVPYKEELMKEIFLVIRRALDNLYGAPGDVVKKTITILHSIAKVHSCSLMLDLECDEIIVEMFELFFRVIGSELPQSVVADMRMIMTTVIEESDEISSKLLIVLLNSVKTDTRETMPCSLKLGKSILKCCVDKLKSCLPKAVRSMGIPLSKFPKIVSLICQGALEGEPLVAREMVVSDGLRQGSNSTTGNDSYLRIKESPPSKKLERTNLRSGRKTMEGKTELRPASSKRRCRPNSLMRPEEGYALPLWTRYARKSTFSSLEAIAEVDKVMGEAVVSDALPQGSNITAGGKKRAKVISGKRAIKGEAEPRQASSKRNRRPNSLMRPEEGYAIPVWTGGKRKFTFSPLEAVMEEMEEPNGKVSKKLRYVKEYGEELVGDRIRVWWPLDQTYSEGCISSFDPISMKHKLLHDDGDEEMLDLGEECWEQIETTP